MNPRNMILFTGYILSLATFLQRRTSRETTYGILCVGEIVLYLERNHLTTSKKWAILYGKQLQA